MDSTSPVKVVQCVVIGEEAYQAAWERGKSLDLEAVVQSLLDEFGDNQ